MTMDDLPPLLQHIITIAYALMVWHFPAVSAALFGSTSKDDPSLTK